MITCPNETLYFISQNTSIIDVCNLSNSCIKLNKITKDMLLQWRKLYQTSQQVFFAFPSKFAVRMTYWDAPPGSQENFILTFDPIAHKFTQAPTSSNFCDKTQLDNNQSIISFDLGDLDVKHERGEYHIFKRKINSFKISYPAESNFSLMEQSAIQLSAAKILTPKR